MKTGKYALNKFHTRDLVLNVMANVARRLDLDIHDDEVADKLYWICCDLEDYPEDCGFGSSDHYGYVQAARKEFGIPEKSEGAMRVEAVLAILDER